MNYEEWLNLINSLNNTNTNKKALEMLKNAEINNNFNELLIPKLEDLIFNRFEKSVNKIINDLNNIFSNVNYLDLALTNYKNEIKYILELIKLKQIPIETKLKLFDKVREQTDNVYNILKKEASNIDQTGIYEMTINNNKIKWSDNNEL